MTEIQVECRSGTTYAERPTALYWEGDRLEVEEILAQWRTPRGRVFRVLVTAGRIFELAYEEAVDRWMVNPR